MPDRGWTGCLAVLLGVIVVFALFDWAPWSKDVTIYPARCRDRAREFSACGWRERVPLNRSSYQIDPARAEVLFRFEDIPGQPLTRLGLTRLSNCVVQDKRNWSCAGTAAGGGVTSTDGQVTWAGLPASMGYVAGWEWWLILVNAKFAKDESDRE